MWARIAISIRIKKERAASGNLGLVDSDDEN